MQGGPSDADVSVEAELPRCGVRVHIHVRATALRFGATLADLAALDLPYGAG
jgi:hypothetical protein